MRVLHFTDVHLPIPFFSIPVHHWLGKRVIGGLNSFFRRRREFAEAKTKLARLAELVQEESVDLVLSTGDHTQLGTEPEYVAVQHAFEPFSRAPLGFVHIPGNHDLYVHDAVRTRRFERFFPHALESDLPELRSDGAWPLVRLFGDDVAVVAVNSARPNPQPWRSSGFVPPRQLEALTRILEDQRLAGRFVFVLTHYAPRRQDGTPDARAHGLVNAEDFLAACARLKRGCILHGHVHYCYTLRVPELHVPIFGAGSTTYAGREGFWVFDVTHTEGRARRGRWREDRYVVEEHGIPIFTRA